MWSPPDTPIFSPVQGNPTAAATPPGTVVTPPVPPDYGAPGMQVLPQPTDVPPLPPGEISRASLHEYPALMASGNPMLPPPQMPTMPTMPGQDDMAFAAARRAQLASTPPWRLSEDDLTWAEQHGLMDEALQIPGVAA